MGFKASCVLEFIWECKGKRKKKMGFGACCVLELKSKYKGNLKGTDGVWEQLWKRIYMKMLRKTKEKIWGLKPVMN